jgi:hypothetical protein
MLLALVLRGWDLTGADLWADEIYTQYRANAPLDDSLESILNSGNQTPVYYMLMRLLPNDTRLDLRLPAFVLGLANVALLIVMVQVLFDDALLGLGAGLLLAVEPIHIILSRTARFYTLLMLLGMIIIWLFLLILRQQDLRQRDDRRLWVAFGVISSVTYITHFTAIGLAVVQAMVLGIMVLRDRDTNMALLRRWIITQVLAVIPLIAWSLTATGYGVNNAYLYGKHYPPLRELPITFGHLLVGYDGRWDWAMLPGLIVAALGLGAGVWWVLRFWVQPRHWRSFERRDLENLFWLMVGVLPIVGLFIVSQGLFGKYKDRYFIAFLPGLLLIFLFGLRRLPRVVGIAALVIAVLSCTYQIIRIYDSGEYERTAWGEAGQYIDQHFEDGDAVFFARWSTWKSFEVPFNGDPRVLEHVSIADEASGKVAVDVPAERLWVVYRIQWEDYHRQNWVEDFDPLGEQVSPMSDWLIAHQDRFISVKELPGIFIYLVDMTGLEPDAPAGSGSATPAGGEG